MHMHRLPVRATLARVICLALTTGLAASANAAEPGNYDAAATGAQAKLSRHASAPAPQGDHRFVHVPLSIATANRPNSVIDARAIARRFALHDAARYGAGVAGADELREIDAQRTSRDAQIVRFNPLRKGIEIFRESVNVLLDAGGNVRAISGTFSGNGNELAAPGGERGFLLDTREAVARALEPWNLDRATTRGLLGERAASGAFAGFAYPANAAVRVDNLRAKPVWFRLPTGLVPAYYVETEVQRAGSDRIDNFAHVIAADDGRLLFRHDQVADAAFTYKVFAEDSGILLPLPGPSRRNDLPHPDATNNGYVPPLFASQYVTLDHAPLDPVFPGAPAFNDPWLAEGATEATGNNAEAYTNNTSPDGFNTGDIRPQVTSTGEFDLNFDLAIAPNANNTQRAAAALHQFYVVNYLHDWFYRAGFDEAAGNAQLSNYGRGGLENDSIKAQGQDYAGTNNANMATPADGGRPRMRMYIFSAPPVGGPNRDGTVDTGIIAHEWGHYISNRLIGDASGLSNQQGGGMGEGWGDFHGLLLLVKEEDSQVATNTNFNGTYATGSFATAGLYASGNQNQSYFGIRRYPYSTDFSKNALTFRHISAGQALPVGIPKGVIGSSNNAEVHNVGEIWASMLWECYAGMLRDTLGSTPRHSFDEARRKMSEYLVAGYKLTPSAPTLTEARDAILASMAVSDQDDFQVCAQGFATRGAGLGAVSPDRNSTNLTGVVESFQTGSALTASRVEFLGDEGCDDDGVLDPGETGTLAITVRNTGMNALSASTLSIAVDSTDVSFPDGDTANLPATLPWQEAQIEVRVSLSAAAPRELLTFTATPHDPDLTNPAGDTANLPLVVNYDEVAATTASFEPHDLGWSLEMSSGFSPELSGWQRVPLGTANTVAHAIDTGGPGQTWMISPPLHVGPDDFGFTFAESHRFEADTGDNYDGGVMDISTDGGLTWAPIPGTAITPGYGGALSSCCDNPLAGRQAFVGVSAGYPTLVTQTVSFGTAYAGQTVQVRFGVATDAAVGEEGWNIDDVAFSGITNQPFLGIADEDGYCPALDFIFIDGFDTATR
jgi:hypothetical protein